MRNPKKSDRPDWWGARWNPNTGTFEDPSSSSSESTLGPEDFFDADEFAKRMGSPGYGYTQPPPKKDPRTYKSGNGSSRQVKSPIKDSSIGQPQINSPEIVEVIDQLLDKIDSQKKDVIELQSLLREEKRRRESLQNENNTLHSEMGKLRQVIRDLSYSKRDSARTPPPSPGPSANTIPDMYVLKTAPKEVFDAVYKALTKLYHPDKKGGSEEKQKKINLAKEEIYKERGWS
jgi:hypothetical protein